MLVPSMNNKEITKELLNDYNILVSFSTFARLAEEYYRERKKLNIKKEAEYTKFYKIKTKSKNDWVIMVSKNVKLKKYQYPWDCAYRLYNYFHSYQGLCVCLAGPFQTIGIYYKHFFQRYRERMELNIPDLLDVVKYFFNNNYLPYNR